MLIVGVLAGVPAGFQRAFGIEVCDQHPDLVEFRDDGAAELHKIAGGKG
jgi:hypothetical protein